MKARRFASIGTSLLVLIVVFGALVFRQGITDWLRLRNYTPSAEIAALAQDTTMLDGSRRLFYVQHPFLADKSTFNSFCRNDEHTIVLGCYIHGQGIYLLDVTDERLHGVEQVTAAHELLHAAYDRLSGNEKKRIDALLQNTYESLTSERIKSTVEQYRSQDPSVVPNELHSIIGTEVRELPQELEEYYSRYFANRSKIVDFSEQYERVFIDRRNQIRDYDNQLASLKDQIEALQASLEQTETELEAQRNKMNGLRASGQIDAHNNEVPSYNAKVNQYNRDIDRLSAVVVQYNDIVQKRNDVATEEAELVEAIDSRDVVPQQQ